MKRIRNAVQELFMVEFTSTSKKEINELILECYHTMMDNKEKSKKAKQMRKDEALSKKLQEEEEAEATGKTKKRKVEAPKKKEKRKRTPSKETHPNSLQAKMLNLSPQLSAWLGVDRAPRTQVVKKIWEYIKANDRLNPADRREILSDEKMEPVLGKKINMFTMQKMISKHLYPDEP